MNDGERMKQNLLSIAGAAIGGVLGYFAFFWVYSYGFYGMVLPGGLLGIGAGLGKSRSVWLAAGCGIAALMLGLVTEWRRETWVRDPSFTYFLMHVPQLNPITLLMIAAGAGLGFWVPYRRVEDRRPAPPKA
jgi:hypothetical protein